MAAHVDYWYTTGPPRHQRSAEIYRYPVLRITVMKIVPVMHALSHA